MKFKDFPRSSGLFKRLHLFNLLDPALNLRGLGCYGTKSVDEFLNTVDLFLLVSVGRHLLLIAKLTLAKITAVISLIGNQLLLINFDDSFRNGVHEVSVMRNHQYRSWVVREISLKPEESH